MAKVLLCDDEESLCRALARLLRSSFDVVTADGPGALARLEEESFDVVVTDLRMPKVSGFDVLEAVRKRSPRTPVIVMSGNAEIHDAVRAMRSGARDFLIKPIDAKGLEEALSNVLGGGAAVTPAPVTASDPVAWRDRVAPWLLGNDPAMLPVFATLAQVADTSCTVLITGESGTGKELVAKSIVAGSARARSAFIPVNCAAIPPSLVESELFGHAKGAFTGAHTARAGRFAQADGGTIFLDEIGEMELNVQAKLLRLIQDGELYPVGEEVPQKIDVRILAATNRKLENEVAGGRFRADLFWRLNVIPVELPALRQRASDVPLLCDHFIRRANERNRRNVSGVDPEAMRALKRHGWPGNIRELENMIERLVIMRGSGLISLNELPPALRASRDTTNPAATVVPDLPDEGTDLRAMLEQVEERMIAEALERTGGNKNRAAELLGLNRTTLVEKLRRRRVAPSA
jgi:DNA-binding NtrC family response regulator